MVKQLALCKRSFTLPSGIILRADEAGPKDAQPIVFLPGGGQTRAAWHGAVRKFGEVGYYALTVDQRGHGESDRASSYVMDRFVEDVGSVIAKLDRPPVLVGASLGGLASLIFSGENTGRIAALVLVDVVPKVDQSGASRIRGFMNAHPDGFASLEEAADSISAYLTHRPRPASLDGLRKNLVADREGRWRWHWDDAFLNGGPGVRFQTDPQRAEAALTNVGEPVLLVRGMSSELLTDAAMESFRAAKPDAQIANIAGAHHMVAGDNNDAFADVVLDFLDRSGLTP